MKNRHVVTLAALAMALVGWTAGEAHAGGIFVPGYGVRALGRAGAFTAKADDPSALFYNPAGFAKHRGTLIHIGLNFIDFSQEFTRAGVYEDVPSGEPVPPYQGQPYDTVSDNSTPALGFGGFQGIPLIAVSTNFGLPIPLRFGLGLYAANGFPEREYNEDYQFEDPNEPPPPGRYDILQQDVSAAFPSVAVAYSPIPDLDIGARLDVGFAGLKAKTHVWAIRNYEEYIGNDGFFSVNVKDNFIPSFGFGVLYRPSPSLELGFNYNYQKKLDAKGHGTSLVGSAVGLPGQPETIEPEIDFPRCAGGGTVTSLKSCVELTLPMTAHLGARYIIRDAKGGEQADVEFDVSWEDWSAGSDIRVTVDGKSGITGLALNDAVIRHGLEDTFSFRLGGTYNLPVGANKISLRGGAAYDTAAAPNSWTRLDLDGFARTTLAVGASYELASWVFDAGGGLVIEPDRTVSACNPDLMNLGCDGRTAEASQKDRSRPDPSQPLQGVNNQVESPFNGGDYSQGYVMFGVGATAKF